MSMMQRILQKAKSESRAARIAFLGDSVTQGCFEIYQDSTGRICPVTEGEQGYVQRLFQKLSALYPGEKFEMHNAGISGDRAPGGLKRLERDVLAHRPDLTVVCYGLNDCSNADESVARYVNALEAIFTALRSGGSEVLFMTPNTMNFYVSDQIENEAIREVAARHMRLQTEGAMDRHIEAAVALCKEMQVRVCDCYACWQAMREDGVDTTALLSNYINHPTREMHELFAIKLAEALFAGE